MKEKETTSTIRDSYQVYNIDAKKITSQLSDIRILKCKNEDWFEEYPISDLIDLVFSSSQPPTTTPISSPPTPLSYDPNRHPSFPNLDLKDL